MTKEQYLKIMHNKDRVVVFIDDKDKIHGFITFFITNDPKKFARDDIWSVPDEDTDGRWLYIDRCITDRHQPIKLNLYNLVKYFNEKFPDKKIIYHSRRRNGKEINLKNT